MTPSQIRRRILDARLHLPEPYRSILYHGTFYPAKNLWVGRDRPYGLVWLEQPEVYIGKENIGTVKLLFESQVQEILSEDR